MKKPLHILQLESTPSDAVRVQHLLETSGFVCDMVRVHSKDDLVDALHKDSFDIVISDLKLPSFNGMEALGISRAMAPDVPFIILSGTMGEEMAVEGILAGATDYVLKSNLARLVPAIRRALQESEDRRERRRVEQELGKASVLLEQTADSVVITDSNGVIEYVNAGFVRNTGFTPAEVIGRTPRLLNAGVHPPEFFERLWATIKSGEVFRAEFTNKRKNGELYQQDETITPIFDSDGAISHFVSTGRDVSERRKVEDALKDSEERFRVLFEFFPDACFLMDLKGIFVAGNKASEELFEYRREELAGKNFFKLGLLPFADLTRAAGIVAANSLGQPTGPDEFLVNSRNGKQISIEMRTIPMKLGQREMVVGIARDITERKKTENALRASEERYRRLFEDAVLGIFRSSPEGKLLAANPAMARMFGYDSPDDIFAGVKDVAKDLFVNPQRRKEILDLATQKAGINRFEVLFKRKDGGSFTGVVHMHLERDSKGKPQYVEGMIEDISERQRTEEALLERELWLRESQRVARVGSYRTDFIRGTWTSSEVLDDIFGIEKDYERTVDGWLSLVHPGDRDEMSRYLADIVEHRAPFDKEYRVVRVADGDERWVHGLGELVFDAKGSLTLMFGTIQDITERRKADAVLIASESRFRSVWEHSKDGMRLTDKKGIMIEVNEAFCKLVQIPREQLVGHVFSTIYSRGGKDDDISLYYQRFSTGAIVPNLQTSVTLWNGAVRELELSNSFIDNEERGTMILSIFRDVTDRNRAERESSLLAHTLRSAKDCISVTDLDNKILFVNEAFETTYGYSERDLVGQNISIVWSPDESAASHAQVYPATLKDGWHGELINRRKNGARFPVEVWTSVVKDEQETPIALVGVARDISERKKIEDQIRQVQKMESIGTLAGGIAHDFNNILGIILGHATMLERGDQDPARLKHRTEAIATAVQRGADLVKQILMFARKTMVKLEPVNVNETITDLSNMFSDTFPKTIDITLDLDGALPVIMIDPTQLHQALLNLCINARDAMTENMTTDLVSGFLKIRTFQVSGDEVRERFQAGSAERYVCIQVSDTGSGIDDVTRQKIFEPFFTTKAIGKGTGLGLSVVYGIVKTHLGHIDVKSEPGHGTTFSLYFPATLEHARASFASPSDLALVRGGTETILLVEDEQELLTVMQAELGRKGYKVLTASDGVEAVKIYTQSAERIALVLSDVGLPKLDGAGLFTTLRQFDPNIRFILASGYLDASLKSSLLEAGAKGFIQKPYDPKEVLERIRTTLDAAD